MDIQLRVRQPSPCKADVFSVDLADEADRRTVASVVRSS